MNRGTVVFLALALLLTHTLAIHQTPDGYFAAPYEIAHVAFRLGRNLVYEGAALWNPGGAAVESHPSPAWVLTSALAARLYLPPNFAAQTLGLLSALGTLVVLAQFGQRRSSGLIAPLLLATSGCAAAAALSGTEAPLAMLLVTASFLAFERGARRALSLSLALLVLTRPEGLAVVLALAGMERLARPRSEYARRPAIWPAYFAPFLVIATTIALRRSFTGLWLSPFAAPLLAVDPERWELGALYLWSFVYASGFGLLFLVLIPSLLLGRVSALGLRSLALASAWWGVVLLSGGDDLPFWNALAPGLPLFFLGVQEILREWMDRRAELARIVWPLLLVTVLSSLVASKVPGDLGPLRLEPLLTRWQTPRGALAEAYGRPFGRLGLLEEIRAVEHLRTLGVFFRHRVGEDTSILTFWPGAIGYLSRKEVLDLSGRAWPLPGEARALSWRGVPRVDVLGALSREADYLVPLIGTLPETAAPGDFLRAWLTRYDLVGATEKRQRELLTALRSYELVCVPVPVRSQDPSEPSEQPFPLLRRKELGLAPKIAVEQSAAGVRVLVNHTGHQQVVDLCVELTDRSGERWYLRPTGTWTARQALDARTSLLLLPSGSRPILLIEAPLPAEVPGARVTAWLHNPGMRPDAALSAVGAPVALKLAPR